MSVDDELEQLRAMLPDGMTLTHAINLARAITNTLPPVTHNTTRGHTEHSLYAQGYTDALTAIRYAIHHRANTYTTEGP